MDTCIYIYKLTHRPARVHMHAHIYGSTQHIYIYTRVRTFVVY